MRIYAGKAAAARGSRVELPLDGGLILALGEACIETTARRTRRELTAALLEGRAAGRAAEEAIDLLERFLADTDFAALRAEHAELAGGTHLRVRILRDGTGAVRWEVIPTP